MNKLQKKLYEATKCLVNNMTDQESREWPPSCFFFTFQGKRPESAVLDLERPVDTQRTKAL